MKLLNLICLVLCLGVVGCTAIPTTDFNYTPTTVVNSYHNQKKGILVVRDFIDKRRARFITHPLAKLWLTYVPLLPYVNLPYERVEETFAKGHKTEVESLASSMAEMIAKDLATTGVFKEVRYVGSGDIPEDAEYILNGVLNSTQFDINASSYMLGVGGVLLWLLPIPIGNQGATIDLSLALTSVSGQAVWSTHLEGESSKLYWLYGPTEVSLTRSIGVRRFGSNDEGIDANSILAYHASALRKGMATAKQSLLKTLSAR